MTREKTRSTTVHRELAALLRRLEAKAEEALCAEGKPRRRTVGQR